MNINAEYHIGFYVVLHIIVIREYAVLCNVENYSIRKDRLKSVVAELYFVLTLLQLLPNICLHDVDLCPCTI